MALLEGLLADSRAEHSVSAGRSAGGTAAQRDYRPQDTGHGGGETVIKLIGTSSM